MNPIISPKNKPLPEHIRKGEYYETNTRGKPEEGKLYALTGKQGQPSIAAGNTWAESEVKPLEEVKTAEELADKILTLYEQYYLDKKPSYDNAANFGCDVLTWCKKIQRRKGE